MESRRGVRRREFASTMPSSLVTFPGIPLALAVMVLLSLVVTSAAVTPVTESTPAQARLRACPTVCVCNMDSVRCVGAQPVLTAVPLVDRPDITQLAITQTSVSRIEQDDFKGLEHVEILFLQQNRIDYIHPLALRNMYKLEFVNLESNRLTTLDPTGLIFQHLPSMNLLILRNNRITNLNAYSFITAVSNETRLDVQLYQNPVQCDCSVLAIKTWMEDLPGDRFALTNLVCENDPRRREYDRVPDSIFGNCQARPCIVREKGSVGKINETNFNVNRQNASSSSDGSEKETVVERENSTDLFEEFDLFLSGNPFGELDSDLQKDVNPLFAHEEDSSGSQTTTTGRSSGNGNSQAAGNSGNSDSNSSVKKCRTFIATKSKSGNFPHAAEFHSESDSEGEGEGCEDVIEEEVEISERPTPPTVRCGNKEDIFDTMFTCHVCNKERTNHACNLQPATPCTGLQMVCLRTVTWNKSASTFLISSRCERYSSCLAREARNAQDCGIGYQSNGNVKCEFCCLGQTCQEDSIGGRTYDLTYYLSYVTAREPYRAYMSDAGSSEYRVQSERITNRVQAEFLSLRGGVDIYLVKFAPYTATQHKVTLRIEVTTLTSESERDILASLEQDMGRSTGSVNGFLFNEDVVENSVLLRKTLQEPGQYCPRETTTTSKGTITWQSKRIGTSHMEACPYQRSNENLVYATRSCFLSAMNRTAYWGPVEDGDCPLEEDEEQQPSLDDIKDIEVTPDNVVEVTDRLQQLTSRIDDDDDETSGDRDREWTTTQVDKVVSVLKTCVEPENLRQEGVAGNVVNSLSNLLDLDEDVMRDAERERATSARILDIIDTVSETGPLTNGRLKVVTSNLAVGAQQISSSESRDVILEANREAENERSLDDGQISFGFTGRGNIPSMDKNSLVLPIPALVDAMTSEEKRKLDRVSFVVYQSDKLFAAPVHRYRCFQGVLESMISNYTETAGPPSGLGPNASGAGGERTTRPLTRKSVTYPQPLQSQRLSLPHPRRAQTMQRPKATTPSSVDNGARSQRVSDGTDDGSGDSSDEASIQRPYVVRVNSLVLSASVPGVKVHDLSENVTMTFEHEDTNSTNPRCVFWDEAVNDWSSDGCGVVTSLPGVTQCGCDHLTNFALLMDVYQEGTGLSSLDRKILSYISYVGCGVSLVALLLTLLTYALFRQVTQYSLSDQSTRRRKLRRDNPSKILINLCLALLLSNLIYLLGMHDYTFDSSVACKVVAVLLHYSLMASLSWMAVEAFYMYLALILVFKTYFTNFILKCALIGWGVPLVIVIATLAIDSTDNYGFINSGMCWLRNPAFYAAFVGPVCVILLVNCLAFALVIKQLSNMASSKLNKTDRNNTVQRLRGAIGVVILLGLTWLFAVFAIGEASVAFYYLFAIFNSLQGLFIFIFYCVLKKDAISAWKRVLPCFEEYGESSKSSSNSSSNSRDNAKTVQKKNLQKEKGVSQSATNQQAMSVKYRPTSGNLHGTTSSSITTSTGLPDSRKASVTTMLENGNEYHTIDDRDVYTNLDSEQPRYILPSAPSPLSSTPPHRPPSYSDVNSSPTNRGGVPSANQGLNFENPIMQRYPYTDETPSHRYSNPSSPKGSPSMTAYSVYRGSQPFASAFSYPERTYQQQQYQSPNLRQPRGGGEGEVDTSNTAKVGDIRLRFERTLSETSNKHLTNI